MDEDREQEDSILELAEMVQLGDKEADVYDVPERSVYGDFSMNSFLIVDVPEPQKDEANSVYMESILDIMKNLNTKLDKLMNEKSEERRVLERAMSFLSIGDSRSAEETMQTYSSVGSVCMLDLYSSLVQKTLPQFFIEIRDELLTIKEKTMQIRNIYNDTDTRLFKKLEENDRLKNIINQQSADHRVQVEELSKENNYLKDEILKITTEMKGSMDSFLEEDILMSLKKRIKEKAEETKKLQEQLHIKEQEVKEYEAKASSFEISHLNRQVEDFKKLQKKLQEENLNLTQIVNKLSERNTKLKQELVYFNGELKKALETAAKKNETILRQKSLIELFQEKICGSEFPIDELRRRKLEIEKRMIKETDYFVKQDLRKQSEDCEKRLADFLNLSRRI